MNRRSFDDNPAVTLEKWIKDFVRESPSNVMEKSGGPFFDEPLVGFAAGDDPIFEQYKSIIGTQHLTPGEALELHAQAKGDALKPGNTSVVSFIMPIAKATRAKQRHETRVGCLEWNLTRWTGQEFVAKLSRDLVSMLEGLGYAATAPDLEKYHKVDMKSFSSNWSQRHIAFAAGLGTFGLTDAFINPRGMAMRCGSVVTNAPLRATNRTFKDHYGACLFYQGKQCGKCIERCPAGAITAKGHDKQKCSDYLNKGKDIVKEEGREGYIGHYAGCGLCQTGVPCETGIPKG
jgi:epoxyqueuosine reductase